MVLQVPGGRIFGEAYQKYLFAPAFFDQKVQGEECEKRQVLGGEPVPVIILPHSHRVLFGFLLKHSATYCADKSPDPSPGADIPFLQSVGSKKLFQEAFKRRLAKYSLHPSASVGLGDPQDRAKGIAALRSATFES